MAEEDVLHLDDFIKYGTAVEQLAEDETSASKPVPIQEQVATDEKGRRRFHGAFTGGFSAGYFNTVGSIEGWTPRTFQSSRQKKGEAMPQRPEDYMDTEDFAVHGIAPKRIVTTDSFGTRVGEGSRKIGVPGAEVPLTALLAPLKESYGVVLLKKMGWKPGQGIGPRITKREKYLLLLKEGQVRVISEEALQAEEKLSAGKLFAPTDTKSVKLEPKGNFHGIGYKGLDMSSGLLKASTQRFSLFDVPEISSAVALPTASAKLKKPRGMTGQAFGVGAFENDDEDIYTMDDMSRYDRVLGDKERKGIQKEALKSIEAPGAARILEGFQRGTIPLHQPKIFPAPVLPRGFTGQHGAILQAIPEDALKKPEKVSNSERHHQQHDAKSRSALLNDEAKAPPVVKSIFDLIPADQKLRIPSFQHAKTAGELTPLPMKTANDVPERPKPVAPPTVPLASVEEMRKNSLALFAGSVTLESKMTFRPFAKDLEKQQRYELFLQRRHSKAAESLAEIWMDVGVSMTEWEREREKAEFFRAAALYRPMSGIMASRFTRETDGEAPSNQVEVSVDSGDVSKERKAAAEKKVYGRLTRDTFEWHPDRLICKRFNVPNPYPTSTLVGILKVKRDKFSMFNFLNVPDGQQSTTSPASAADGSAVVEDLVVTEQFSTKLGIPHSKTEIKVMEVAPVVVVAPLVEPKKLNFPEKSSRLVPPQPEVEISTERPSMDLFRAIFNTSDVEEEEENDESQGLLLSSLPDEPSEEFDQFQNLLETNKRARALEKKEFPVARPESTPVIGPERPSAAMLATYAALADSLKREIPADSSSDDDRQRKKRKREKSKKSDKKHKKSKKHHKKDKDKRRTNDSTDSDHSDRPSVRSKKKHSAPAPNIVKVPATESSPDIEAENIIKKLRAAVPGKRLTAADFM